MSKLNMDHVIRLIQSELNPFLELPFRNQLIKMLRLQDRIDNAENESFYFKLGLPHHRETLSMWVNAYDTSRKSFNQTTVDEFITALHNEESELNNVVPYLSPMFAKVLMYNSVKSYISYFKDMISIKATVDMLPVWNELKNNEKLLIELFK